MHTGIHGAEISATFAYGDLCVHNEMLRIWGVTYALLTMSPFRLPTDYGPLAIFYPSPTQIVDNQGALVLDATDQTTYVFQPTIGRAEQAMINPRFKRARNYWLLYMNI